MTLQPMRQGTVWIPELNPSGKLSPNDAVGMLGDRSRMGEVDYYYQPQGYDKPIHRPAGSLRLKRGDTSLLTLSKTYRDFCNLFTPWFNLADVCLADLRRHYNTVSISDIRKKIRTEGAPK